MNLIVVRRTICSTFTRSLRKEKIMLNIRTVILSVVVLVVLMLTAQLATAGTEVVSVPSNDPVIGLDHQDRFDKMNPVVVSDHQDRYDKMNEAPVPSYRSPLDECFDVPLGELTACRAESRTIVPSYRDPLDECFDVPISELASCRNK